MNLNSDSNNKVPGREGQADGQIVRDVGELFHVLRNWGALFIPT